MPLVIVALREDCRNRFLASMSPQFHLFTQVITGADCLGTAQLIRAVLLAQLVAQFKCSTVPFILHSGSHNSKAHTIGHAFVSWVNFVT